MTNENQVINLYNGAAPGSEAWNYREQSVESPLPVVYNVAHPTLTAYLPKPDKANGKAIILCPGGGFFLLGQMDQTIQLAQLLSEWGIAAFVLKYRLGESLTDNPVEEFQSNFQRPDFQERMNVIIPLAVADGRKAISYLRLNADKYNLSPGKIGILGFSAGAAVASIAATGYNSEQRPAFIGCLYGFIPPEFELEVPEDAPPLFLAVANDDPLGLAPLTTGLYLKWQSAKKPAELHVYQKGGHGFITEKQGLPVDNWVSQFRDWLNQL